LFYAEDVNILGRGRHTIKNNTEVDSKDIGIEHNAGKTKYMVMSRDQSAELSYNIKTENRSFESVKEFKYLGTILTNQNSIQKEIKIRLKPGNACHQLVQNILSYNLLSKNLKIKICRIIILPVFVWV
jgi:hypothetical protein